MIIQMTGSTRIICHLFIFCNCAGIAQDLYPIRGERERLFLTDRKICVSI